MARALLIFCLLLFALPAFAQEEPAPAEEPAVVLPPPAPPCGTQPITIARMPWPSAEILAEIHARLLASNYNCEVRVVPGDLAATGSSMGTTGQPAVAPEMWITRIPEIWNQATKAQQVRQAGSTFAEPVLEGWFVPDYVAEARPDVLTASTLKDAWQLFTNGGSKGRFVSCPIDWGCAVVNRNLLRAYGLDQLFDVVEPANRFELDTLIAEAVSRQEPLLFYYWQPNAVLAQFGFKPLDLGVFNAEAFICAGRRTCATPAPTSFAPDPVIIGLSEWVFLEAPEIAAYFSRARMPLDEMNRLLALLSEDGATIESIADNFVAERAPIWRPWVGLPVEEEPAPAQ
jgi:glycine betaine/proline transport system substrate-binding protein